jgi:hypothetical protein
MKTRLITSLIAASCLALASAAEPGWVKIDAKPLDWPDALPLPTKQRSALVLDMPSATHLRGFVGPSPRKPGLTEPQIRAQVAGLIETLAAPAKVELKIEWLAGDEQPVDFTRSILPADRVVRSSYRLGGTRITRTVIADEEERAIFIHLIADKPGALSFRVILSVSGEGEPKIEDRRQLVRTAAAAQPASIGVHVWVLPFESDVAPDGDSIIVRGEGEALILLTYATASETTKPLAETLARLGRRHDPDHNPPDPAKIWHGVLANHLKSAENSP